MKKFLTATCVSAMCLASAAVAADLTQESQALRAKALADSTAWDVLESLTTEVGPRSVGTPAIVRAKDWGLAKLTALGFENVHAEPFLAQAWVRGAESAEVISPFPQKLAILGLGGSAPTSPGGLEAEIVLFKSLQELQAQPPGALKGKIAVITQAMRRTQGPDGYGAGVPVVDFDQDASRYFDLHHSADDTLDKVDPKKLAQNVAVWAAFLRVTANSDVDFRTSTVAP